MLAALARAKGELPHPLLPSPLRISSILAGAAATLATAVAGAALTLPSSGVASVITVAVAVAAVALESLSLPCFAWSALITSCLLTLPSLSVSIKSKESWSSLRQKWIGVGAETADGAASRCAANMGGGRAVVDVTRKRPRYEVDPDGIP